MTNEAPTPDAERLVRNLKNVAYAHGQTDSVEYGSDKKYRLAQEKSEEAAGALRAHIASLEAKLAEQIREDKMRLINHCVKVLGNNSKAHIHAEAEFLTKIAELEAENKRLRDLLGGANYTYLGAEYVACLEPDAITAALAQTGEK